MATKKQRFILLLSGVICAWLITGCGPKLAGAEPPAIDYAADALGVVVDENMQVLHIEPGRAADQAGVQVGDVLDSVEGVSLLKERGKAKAMIHEPKRLKSST
ncbi:MAG: PDZ domain-containing protein [Caldilineaceae bacterium]